MSFLHASPAVRNQIFFFVREVASADQVKYLLGAWCLTTYDVDRQVASRAHQSWEAFVSTSTNAEQKLHLDSLLITSIWDFVQEVIFDPTTVYLNINPPQPIAPSPPQRRGVARIVELEPSARIRSEEDEEDEQDRAARLRVEAFGAAQWVLSGSLQTFSVYMLNNIFFLSIRFGTPSQHDAHLGCILRTFCKPCALVGIAHRTKVAVCSH